MKEPRQGRGAHQKSINCPEQHADRQSSKTIEKKDKLTSNTNKDPTWAPINKPVSSEQHYARIQ